MRYMCYRRDDDFGRFERFLEELLFVLALSRKDRSTVSTASATSMGTSNTPFSHLATVLGWTPRVSASCTWVNPKAVRLAFSSLPFMKSASYILETKRSIPKVFISCLT